MVGDGRKCHQLTPENGCGVCLGSIRTWQLKEALVLLTPVALHICQLCNDKKSIMNRTNRLRSDVSFPYLTERYGKEFCEDVSWPFYSPQT